MKTENGPAERRRITNDDIRDLYAILKQLARNMMKGEGRRITLQTTVLLHDAMLRMLHGTWTVIAGETPQATAMRAARFAMRQILADYGRRRSAKKRGPGATVRLPESDAEIQLDDAFSLNGMDPADKAALWEALSRLDDRFREVVELRAFGLSLDEIAAAVGRSLATVKRDLVLGRARLASLLDDGASAV